MEIKKNIIIIIIFYPLILFSKEYNYEVSIFGVYCADIKINYSDTIFNNQNALKINYETKTRKEIDYFFFIDNKYTSIINIENYNMLSYYKNTKQPEITNNIITYYKNDSLFYSNKNQPYNNEYYNIFSLLYFLQMNDINDSFKSLDFLEREGNIYNMKIETIKSKNRFKYLLSLEFNNTLSKEPIYKNTDIFTWGLFLPNSKRELIIDPISNIITSCKFSIGLINVTAKLK